MNTVLLPGVEVDRIGPVAELLIAERERPDALLLRWQTDEWSVREFADAARRCAALLQGRGVEPGDRIAIVSGNSQWRLAWQFGIYWLGAVEISINSELRGAMLQHCLEDSDPALILLEPEFQTLLDGMLPEIKRLDSTIVPVPIDDAHAAELDRRYRDTRPADLSTILYTSGTTGPSKGVMLSQAYFANLGAVFGGVLELAPDDIGYFTLPFFHVDFHIVFAAAIQRGAAIAFNRRFSVSRFWSEVREFDASWVFVIGALLSALETRELPHGGHRVTRFIGAPIPPTAREYFGRAGIRIQAFYGQTECDGPTFETMNRHRDGSAGWACAGIAVEIQNDAGEALPQGEIGQIVLRPQYPNMLSLGYWRRPEATLASRSGLWHHTGDLGRFDEDGFLFYEGRLTDSLRRRGENISAYELESVLRGAPAIVEGVAISVYDELGGEDEIKVVAQVSEGFDPAAFFTYCEAELPRFAVPRYLELVQEGAFVRSVGTGVVQKHRLSKTMTGESIYDRADVLNEKR